MPLTPSASAPWLALDGPASPAVERVIDRLSNPWSVSRDTARFLARLVAARGVRRVIEFGAGMSSVVLATALSEAGGGALVSVEEDPAWCEAAWDDVRAHREVEAHLLPARVGVRLDARGVYFGYRRPVALRAHGPFDLVFVDAPWGRLGREGSVYAVAPYLAPGALIVLDDAARAGEQAAVRTWTRLYPALELVMFRPDLGRGVAVLEARGALQPQVSGAVVAESVVALPRRVGLLATRAGIRLVQRRAKRPAA